MYFFPFSKKVDRLNQPLFWVIEQQQNIMGKAERMLIALCAQNAHRKRE